MVSFDTPPLDRIDTSGAEKTPEVAIVSIIQQQPAFEPSRNTEYIGDPHNIVQSAPFELSDYNLNGEFPAPGQKGDIEVSVRNKSGKKRVVVDNIWVRVDGVDNRIGHIQFKAWITVPIEAIEERLWTEDGQSWAAERISTEWK